MLNIIMRVLTPLMRYLVSSTICSERYPDIADPIVERYLKITTMYNLEHKYLKSKIYLPKVSVQCNSLSETWNRMQFAV